MTVMAPSSARAGSEAFATLKQVSVQCTGEHAQRKPGAAEDTRGAVNIGICHKRASSYRKWCSTCGGHIFMDHLPMGLIDVYAALIQELPYAPGVHVHYQEAVLQIHDGM